MVTAAELALHENYHMLDKGEQNRVFRITMKDALNADDRKFLRGMAEKLERFNPGERKLFMPAMPEADEDGYLTVDTDYLGEE